MSGADLLEDGFPHGTVDGFLAGCRGGSCPVEHGMTCRRAKQLAAGDYRYARLAAQGLTPAEIAAELGEGSHEHPAPAPRRPVVQGEDDEDDQVDDLNEPIEGEDPIMTTIEETAAPTPATIIKSRKPEPQPAPDWPDEASESSATSSQADAEPEVTSGEIDLTPATIRAWARENRVPVNVKGSVRKSVVEAYMVAHGHIIIEAPGEQPDATDTWPGNNGDRLDHDPTHGRVDKDIQEGVDALQPSTLGQRVAIEQTLQERRDAESAELAALNAEADGEPDLPAGEDVILSVDEYGARLRDIRHHQVEKGYTPEHDDAHGLRHLLNWAIDYARRGRTDDSSAMMLAALESLDRGAGVPVVVHGPLADMETRAELFNEGWDEARKQSFEVTIESLAESLEFALRQWAAAVDRARAAETRADAAERDLVDARRPWWRRAS